MAGKRPEPRRNGGPAAPKGSRAGRVNPLVLNLAAKALRDGAALEQQRRFSEAHKLYTAALNEQPHEIAILEAAARTAALAEDHRGAVNHLRLALATDPKRHILRERLAGALLSSGDLAAAEEEAKTLNTSQPGKASILNLLGVIQKRRGRVADAITTFREGAAAEPSVHSSWYNLGNTLLGMGEFAEARDALKRASELRPRDSETVRLLGQALIGLDEHEAAIASFDRALKLDPKNCRVFTSRAAALQRARASDESVLAEIDKAIALEPDNAEHRRAKAAYLQRRSRFAEAEAVHKELLERDPNDVETLLRLGHMLGYSLRRYEEANGFLRRALKAKPDDPSCLSGLCKSLLDSRYGNEADHIEEAGKVGRQLAASAPDILPHAANLYGVFLRLCDYEGLAALGDRSKLMQFWVDRMNVGSLHNQLGRVVTREDRRELVHWHREWGRRVEEQAAKTPVKRPPPRTEKREKIRIGLMSSDLRDHPVAYFALPIIEHYDRDRFELVCYSFYPEAADRVQNFVAQRVLKFRSMLQATDQEIAQQIADDDLDILFELGGSTRYNRLEVMAYRAAPVQASWLGYPHSAGIGSIDYILVDPYLKPDDASLLIEKPFVMPESWVCLGRLGFRNEPIEPGIPEERAGALTFGTMNNPYKYTPELFALWAEVMRRVPGSRFLFVRPEAGAPSFRSNVAREFAKHGVTEDRLLFEAVRGKHMRHYNRIDIALDTAPHTGGTTTCETLWMGVPTVTLVGEAFFERLSYSNLSNAGLEDLCTFSRTQYVDVAVALAKDRARRLDLRKNLRERLRTSPLGDAKRWVKNFESTVESTLGRPAAPPETRIKVSSASHPRPEIKQQVKPTKAVILAGGRGTRLSEETHLRPKPMVEIGGRPILWHIMKIYAAHGIVDFIVCLGYQGYVIKEYFANYLLHSEDVSFDLAKGQMEFLGASGREPWRVTLVDTGISTETGGRVGRLRRYLENEDAFCLTYGDGLGNIDIKRLLNFHRAHGKLATMTVVHPPGRFGVVGLEGDKAVTFEEKPNVETGFINGGFFVLNPKVLQLIEGDRTVWEREPLERLAKEGELAAFRHDGFWQPMDTLREKEQLEAAWQSGRAPWKVWE